MFIILCMIWNDCMMSYIMLSYISLGRKGGSEKNQWLGALKRAHRSSFQCKIWESPRYHQRVQKVFLGEFQSPHV